MALHLENCGPNVRSFADTFDDFPDAPSELIGAVNYISIPGGTSISGCNLYKYESSWPGEGVTS